MQNRLRALGLSLTPAILAALRQEAETILEASKPLVPVDTRSLQDSGHVDTPSSSGTLATVTIRYGGTVGRQGRVPETYAIRLHEDLSMNHPRGGQAKFLETPLLAATQGMLARLGSDIRTAL